MQASKIIKKLIAIFFNNFDMVVILKYQSYKNVDKIKALLTKLLYDKIT